jgi:hypothetical protein
LNKGTKIALGVMAILLLACLGGLISMLNDASGVLAREKEKSIGEANAILVLAASSWNYNDVALRTSSEFPAQDEAQRQFVAWQEQYGNMVTGEMKLTKFSVADENFKDATLVSQFEGVVEFQKGKGTVTMTLTRKPKNAWELAEFDVRPAP